MFADPIIIESCVISDLVHCISILNRELALSKCSNEEKRIEALDYVIKTVDRVSEAMKKAQRPN